MQMNVFSQRCAIISHVYSREKHKVELDIARDTSLGRPFRGKDRPWLHSSWLQGSIQGPCASRRSFPFFFPSLSLSSFLALFPFGSTRVSSFLLSLFLYSYSRFSLSRTPSSFFRSYFPPRSATTFGTRFHSFTWGNTTVRTCVRNCNFPLLSRPSPSCSPIPPPFPLGAGSSPRFTHAQRYRIPG